MQPYAYSFGCIYLQNDSLDVAEKYVVEYET